MVKNDRINAEIRRAAGRLPPQEAAPAPPAGQGNDDLAYWIATGQSQPPAPARAAGSADGGAGVGSEPRASFTDMMNAAIRDRQNRNRSFTVTE